MCDATIEPTELCLARSPRRQPRPAETQRPDAAPDDAHGAVVFYGGDARARGHDRTTKAAVARMVADLLGMDYAGDYIGTGRAAGPLYLVPAETLDPQDDLAALGIRSEADFFGGYVPQPFIATKLITHPRVRAGAAAPAGWSRAHGAAIRSAVLPGRSVFSAGDARRAADELLALGPVRLKDPAGVGGAGQWVVKDRAELESHLERIDPQALRRDGLVLEQNLNRVTTCSVGQVRVGRWLASYFGTQRLTRNGRDHPVYGGSTLTVFLGALDSLPALAPDEPTRTAVRQSLRYHRGAFRHYPGLIASRCNYDVVQGLDDAGRWHSGVLEQSWRIGGASGAEIAALLAFRGDPGLRAVRASTCELYGADAAAPAGASVLFDGVDQHGDRLVKYVEVHTDVDP
jgi:hypothetical protein